MEVVAAFANACLLTIPMKLAIVAGAYGEVLFELLVSSGSVLACCMQKYCTTKQLSKVQ